MFILGTRLILICTSTYKLVLCCHRRMPNPKFVHLLWIGMEQHSVLAAMFATWVNVELLPNYNLPPGFPKSITPQTARKWLIR